MISINGTRFHTYQRISRLLHINGDKLSVLQLICTLLPCWLGCWCWSSCFIHRQRIKKTDSTWIELFFAMIILVHDYATDNWNIPFSCSVSTKKKTHTVVLCIHLLLFDQFSLAEISSSIFDWRQLWRLFQLIGFRLMIFFMLKCRSTNFFFRCVPKTVLLPKGIDLFRKFTSSHFSSCT